MTSARTVTENDGDGHDAPTRIVVHLVHGTWAPEAPWTLKGSHFRCRLESRLRRSGLAVPIEFVTPGWHAGNRQIDRVSGAERVREAVREHSSRRTRQLLIGHSHGGSVCCLACATGPDSVADQVAGIVCLSTPFIVFRDAPYMRWMYASCWVAWMMAALVVTGAFTEGPLSFVLVTFVAMGTWAAFFAWTQRNGYRDPERISPPATLPMPALLMRSPGDEASGALGATLILERLAVVASGRVSGIWAWLNRHPGKALLLVVAISFAVPMAVLACVALWGSSEPLKWPGTVVATLLGIVLVCPLLFALPLRSLLHGLSYGFDVATRGVFLDVTAEATPPGRWAVHTILPRRSETLPGLMHSELYDSDDAIDAIAEWVREVVRAPTIRTSGDASVTR